MTPHREKPLSRRVNGLVVLDFFHRLEGEEERQKLCFRYVLGLMLMRKKLLKFSGVHRGEGGEEVLLTDPGSGVEYRVCDPKLSPAEVTGLTEEVGKLLNVQFEEPREETGTSAAAQAPQEGATSSEVGSQDTGGTR
jgi:hypothetical protein